MALSNILREYLVRIGFESDDASRRKFTEAIKGTTEIVLGLGAAIEATATAVVAGIAKMSESMERFYFISQRTGASVANIKALGYAAQQMGIGAESAYNALENIAAFLRSSPLAGGLLQRLGIDPKQDPEKIFEGLSKAFANMPVWMAKAYAQVLGIDENTMLAMRRGMGEYLDDYQKILQRVGVNEQKAAEGAHKFMVQLRGTLAIMHTFSDYVLQLVGEKAGNYIEQFKDVVERNFTKVADITANIIVWLLRAADVVTRFVVRGVEGLSDFYNAFMRLPAVVRYVLEAVTALMIAFAAVDWPILAVGALASAIMLLYDDFKTFKEGGKHLIDWDRWIKDFDAAKAYLSGWWNWLVNLFQTNTFHIKTIYESLFILPALLINHWQPLLAFFRTFWGEVGKIFNEAWGIVGHILDKLMHGVDWISNSWLGRKLGLTGGTSALADRWKQGLQGWDNFIQGEVGGAFDKAGNWISSVMPTGTSVPATGGGPGGNHNLGNLRVPGSSTEFQSFGSDEEGAAAIRDQLRRYAARGINTVRSIINTWAPPSDHNPTNQYVANVAGWGSLNPDAPLDLNDSTVMAKLMSGIIRQEGHAHGDISNDMLLRIASMGTSGGQRGDVHIDQHNEYHIAGGDPHATGKAVQVAQDTSNQRLIRNLQPVTQ